MSYPLIVWALWLAVSSGATPAQDIDSRAPGRDAQLKAWVAAVTRHQPGAFGVADVDIASLPDEQLTAIINDVRELTRFLVRARERFRRTGGTSSFDYDGRDRSVHEVGQLLGLAVDEAQRGEVGRLVLRGVLLHTDVAVTFDGVRPVTGPAGSSAGTNAILVLDGRQRGATTRGPHWRLARSLLDVLPADSPHVNARRNWYVATAAYMWKLGVMADLVPHMERATALFPDDAEILFHAGAMNETLAAPFIQEAIRGISLPAGVTLDVVDGRAHLQRARTFLGKALALDAAHVEARLRLGRVLGRLGRHEEAAAELQRVEAAASTDVIRYYAALFLGGEQAKLGQLNAARQSFELAAAIYPRAQSPRLGLSGVARAEGRQAEASALLTEALAVQHEDDLSRDPWWTYFVSGKDEANRAIGEWRRTIAEAVAR
jgi:tetratricopeptide (TPR) repeat protein